MELIASDKARFEQKDGSDTIHVMVSEGRRFTGAGIDPIQSDETEAIHLSVQKLIHEVAHAYRVYQKKEHTQSDTLRSFLIDEKRTRQLEQRMLTQIGADKFDDPGIKSIEKIAFDTVSGGDLIYLEKYYLDWAREKVEENFSDLEGTSASVPPKLEGLTTSEMLQRHRVAVEELSSRELTLREIANSRPSIVLSESMNESLKQILLEKIETVKSKIENLRSSGGEGESESKRETSRDRTLDERIAFEYLGISEEHANMLGLSR